MKTMDREVAEQATGIRQHGSVIGKFYAGPINIKGMVTDSGRELGGIEARDHLEQGGQVAVPCAGAGSYKAVFNGLGFHEVKVFDWTSSAGDWNFAVWDGANWFPAFQSNRYPHHGFCYSVDFEVGFDTAEDCFGYMSGY